MQRGRFKQKPPEFGVHLRAAALEKPAVRVIQGNDGRPASRVSLLVDCTKPVAVAPGRATTADIRSHMADIKTIKEKGLDLKGCPRRRDNRKRGQGGGSCRLGDARARHDAHRGADLKRRRRFQRRDRTVRCVVRPLRPNRLRSALARIRRACPGHPPLNGFSAIRSTAGLFYPLHEVAICERRFPLLEELLLRLDPL